MINAKAFHQSLEEVLGNGVEIVLSLGLSGTILGSASSLDTSAIAAKNGDVAEEEAFRNHSLLASVVTNMWLSYSTNDLTANIRDGSKSDPESLEALLFEVSSLKVCVVGCGGTSILCLAGRGEVHFGMLKLKAAALQRHLDSALRVTSV